MKNLYSVTKLLSLLLGLGIILHSCIRDNRDDCEDDGRLTVRIVVSTLAEQTRTGNNGTIDDVVIYVFDRQGMFVDTWNGGAYTYGEKYVAEMEIDPGSYQFVVWTNQKTAYQPDADPDSADKLVVSLQYPENNKITEDIPDLHHGILTGAQVIDGEYNEFLVVVRPNTYTLKFTAVGLETTTNDYSFTVRDNNTHYSFDNTIVDGQQEVEYIRVSRFTGDKLSSSMKVLRLTDERSPHFDFSDITKGKTLHSDNLVQMIITAYRKNGHEVDFDSEFEFDIILEFDADLGVTVSVNGWSYSPNPGNLG